MSIEAMHMQVGDTYSAISHVERGDPQHVLHLVQRPIADLSPGPREVIVRVRKRPIHPGDLLMIAGDKRGGTPGQISPVAPRTPGFEGVGVIEDVGDAVNQGQFPRGARVMFFSGTARSWAEYARVSVESLVPVPDDVDDATAAQLLINTMTAQVVLRTGHFALPIPQLPVTVIQNAAGSAVMRIITALGLKIGLTLIRLVRSDESAVQLARSLPGGTVISTQQAGWQDKVRAAAGTDPIYVAFDAVGGSQMSELATLLMDGGTIVNFGWLGDGAPDLSNFAPRRLTFRGIIFSEWFSLPQEEREKFRSSAIELARTVPEAFPVAAEYPLANFREAIDHATRPSKSGIVLLTS